MAELEPSATPPAPETPNDRIEDLQIEQELQDSYLTYAMSTIMDRALPDVRDGLKPSQRRILVAMNDLNLLPGRKHLKCAKIAGDTSGNYHPHGEAVIYPTLVRMAQHWSLRYPLIDGQGNFGSTDGDPPAAMRYTEARMAHPAAELLADLKLDTVDFQPNYDERPGLDEPTVLPGKFPNLLVNGSTGIAVGMACNLLPHNLREICDAIVHVIDHPECTLPELLEIVPGPDFPTGGIICGRDGIVEGYKTGRGRITLRAKIHTEEHKGGKEIIVIDEIPYGIIRKIDRGIGRRVREEGSDQRHQRHQRPQRPRARLPDRDRSEARRRPERGHQPALSVHAVPDHGEHDQHRAGQPPAAHDGAQGADPAFHRAPQGGHHPADAIPAEKGPAARAYPRRLIFAVCDIDEVIRLIRTQQDARRGDRATAPAGVPHRRRIIRSRRRSPQKLHGPGGR